MERAVLVYTTWPSIVEAETAGRKIVERRLAACVNILPGMISHYWWEGKIERAEEVVMLVKTRASLAEPVRAAVKELHSYTTPAVMVLAVENLDPDYHRWIVAGDGQLAAVVAGLGPAIPIRKALHRIGDRTFLNEVAGTRPAMTSNGSARRSFSSFRCRRSRP